MTYEHTPPAAVRSPWSIPAHAGPRRGVASLVADEVEMATELAAELARCSQAAPLARRLPLLGDGEAIAVAALLDELVAVHLGEDLTQLARNLALRLRERMDE